MRPSQVTSKMEVASWALFVGSSTSVTFPSAFFATYWRGLPLITRSNSPLSLLKSAKEANLVSSIGGRALNSASDFGA